MTSLNSFIRHKHGNGKKFDTSEASINSYLHKSELHGETHCFESIIIQSKVYDSYLYKSEIISSTVETSIIAGAIIQDCIIRCHSISGERVIIRRSDILGESVISGNVKIVNSNISNLIVSGNASIIDWNLLNLDSTDFQSAHIASGEWRKPPRIHRFDELDMTITESTNGKAFIGCIEKDMSEWIKCGDRFGIVKGWSPHHVEELKEIFAEWIIKTPQNFR
jgi:NDP-sugar pyrophosphorylase family protein